MGAQASSSVQAGGLTWAYRTADVAAAAATPDKLPVLCLHGLGSCSYAYRNTIRLLGDAGHATFAPDWPGHGESSKPAPGAFDYSADAYVAALEAFTAAVGLKGKPYALVVHGFVLGQYGLLFALQNEADIRKLVVLPTPLGLKSKLRPELAAYKAPLAFMRPKPDAAFDAMTYNAAGSPYAMAYKDAECYAAPYAAGPAAAAALHATMDRLDFPALLRRVDEEFESWRVPSLVVVGTADPFADLPAALGWLETKRTTMKMATGLEAKLGHCPQEDYAEAVHPAMLRFFESE
jgi:haloalkane dehalogenase